MNELYLIGMFAAAGAAIISGSVGGLIFLLMAAIVVKIVRDNI